ncbi:methylmalonyl Co-A mutase-associated GTPase MeaB [Pseudonocardia sp. KRD291]|uniref:methylmalonyl Co-A mutase-associated GTPase MeaB n=1 Tax=Pseudonocardia sp. KRD291 TaxID=2792007 RepID=UPI001C4A74F0|nr:methylmalonyl Co-A mutase-associated GTPase MeaB [Pseudonocardia sp. KRD291]MBW0105788.1 methylmalonyl Co-A mutase-associated GTPase MeaB [Pseudonocardia sp. KRD291]
MPAAQDPQELVTRAREGQQRAVAKLISLVENASPQLREVAAALAPHAGHAQIVGLTGAPGVGKSTTTSALVTELRGRDLRVGVLAVDPSSPFSGGALLGDRVRMGEHATDDGVFIRSMATRGHLGGLAWATPQALRVLDAAGCDVVLVETVGVGQSEVDVARLADTTVVLLAPGMGDGVQAAKAGILEIGDVFAVNKADRDGARQTVRELKNMLHLREGVAASDHATGTEPWTPRVLSMVAARTEGVDGLADAVTEHRAWSEGSGALRERRRRRAQSEIEAISLEQVRSRMEGLRGGAALPALADRVLAGELDPYSAADELRAGATDL